MPQHYDTRSFLRAATGLDFGLRVRVETRCNQRAIFSGSENFSVRELTSEVAELVAGLRVYSYSLRANLEQVTVALQHGVESGEWRYARRAALDLAGLLAQGVKRRQIHSERAVRGANACLRIADLIGSEVR